MGSVSNNIKQGKRMVDYSNYAKDENDFPPEPIKQEDFEVISYRINAVDFSWSHDAHEIKPQSYENYHNKFIKFKNKELKTYGFVYTPLYFISVTDFNGKQESYENIKSVIDENSKRGMETIAYIGQTLTDNARFANGHKATQKLNHPKYDLKSKRIFLFDIWVEFRNNGIEYDAPLEWLSPDNLVTEITKFLEWFLIYYYRNTVGEVELNSTYTSTPPNASKFIWDVYYPKSITINHSIDEVGFYSHRIKNKTISKEEIKKM